MSHFDGAYFYRLDGIAYRHPASDGLATTLAGSYAEKKQEYVVMLCGLNIQRENMDNT